MKYHLLSLKAPGDKSDGIVPTEELDKRLIVPSNTRIFSIAKVRFIAFCNNKPNVISCRDSV